MSRGDLRLFVAAGLPADLLAELERWVGTWRAGVPAARWTAPGGRHLTLKFLGSTPPERAREVAGAVADAASWVRGGEVALDELGAFPSLRRARILWAGVRDEGAVLGAAARALDESLGPLGFEPEQRPFHPHLTLARLRVPADLSGRLPSPGEGLRRPFAFDRLRLYRSHLAPQGATYEVLAEFELRR